MQDSLNNPKSLPTKPYGSWPSDFSAESLASSGKRLGDIRTDNEDVYWLESRPAEKGRMTLMRQSDGEIEELLAAPYNIRSSVHEYGGAAFTVQNGNVYFVNHSDKELYMLPEGHQTPVRLTNEADVRYADLLVDVHHNRLIFVREDHRSEGHEPENMIGFVSLDARDAKTETLIQGADFYASPALSPDGSSLAWLSWNHPALPWDSTYLYAAKFNDSANLEESQLIAGSKTESVFQPMWSPGGELYFSSDRNGWWNIHRYRNQAVECVVQMEAEFAWPQWVFGMSTSAFVNELTLACAYTNAGLWKLALINLENNALNPIDLPFSWLDQLRATKSNLIFQAASPTLPKKIVSLKLESSAIVTLASTMEVEIRKETVSAAREIVFQSEGHQIQAFFYPPENPYVEADNSEKPPLIVMGHSGPTAATDNSFSPKIQYWCSRGFAVLDVNYRGSTSFGRKFRELLNFAWGIADVEDCVNGARYAAEAGLVDPERLIIRGSSAGGFTALAALAFHDVFSAGAVIYGIGDLEALTKETHKFEARYNDILVAPYPDGRDEYIKRSPLYHTDKIKAPAVFFQGLDDKVVLPAQAEAMVGALKQNGTPVAYITYENEGHGFRNPETIIDSLQKELSFYGRIFGFDPHDEIESIQIENKP